MADIEHGRLGQVIRLGSGDLYHHRRRLIVVLAAQQAFAGMPQGRVGGAHFGHGIDRTEAFAELPEGQVSDTGHRRHQTA